LPANAYSAATLMAFAGDEIVMTSVATLGPVDPQIAGIPARAILRAFERIEKRLAEEGPRALTAYLPLLSKYDLHILEMCRSAEELSLELTRKWLASYMFRCDATDTRLDTVSEFFASYDLHKSHGRGISRETARGLGLAVRNIEEFDDLPALFRSLYNQYELWFEQTPGYKCYENAHGISWGRNAQQITVQLPTPGAPGAPGGPAPQPGPPRRTNP
jgi:hypothetical protein